MVNSYNIYINNISSIGDILAIPLFAILIYYFYKKNNKTRLEYFLFLFSIFGFILDIIFTIIYFTR